MIVTTKEYAKEYLLSNLTMMEEEKHMFHIIHELAKTTTKDYIVMNVLKDSLGKTDFRDLTIQLIILYEELKESVMMELKEQADVHD